MNFLGGSKKRGVSKKKFLFFMLYLDSTNKKSDRMRYQFFHPTPPTPLEKIILYKKMHNTHIIIPILAGLAQKF